MGLVIGLVALIVILVFILQNLHDAKVSFFAAHWDIPLGLDLLLAALLGGVIVSVAGAARIAQLRMTARRQHRELHGDTPSRSPARG